MTTSHCDGQFQLTTSPVSQMTWADLGLSHTCGSSARRVPKPSPDMAAHRTATQRQHTGESQSLLPSGWMKPYDDGKGGTQSCPTTAMQSTPQIRCKTEMFFLPHQNCSSPKYSLQLVPAPHIAQDAAATLAPSMLSSTLPKAPDRSTLTTPKTREKGLQDSYGQF